MTTTLSTDSETLSDRVRASLKRPARILPRADAALLKACALILFMGCAAVAFAVQAGRTRDDGRGESQAARVGSVLLAVPQELSGAETHGSSRVVGMVRLRLAWPDLGAVTAQTANRLLVTLSPPDKVNEPATQLSVYARFLTSTVWSNPGGLVVRGFRKGSPYQNEELYVSVPDGRGFAARCPVDAGAVPLDELCRVTFRHRGMDVNIRFPRGIIADWELMLGGVRRTIDSMMR